MPSITSASRFSHVVYYFLLSMSSKRRHLSFTSTDLFDEVGLPSRYSSNMSVPGSFPQLSTTTGVCKFDRIVFVQATPRMQPERWYKAWSFYVRGDRNLRYWGSILPIRPTLRHNDRSGYPQESHSVQRKRLLDLSSPTPV